MNNGRKGISMIVVLSCILVGVLTLGIIKDKKLSKENKEDYNNYIASQKDKVSDTESTKEKGDAENSDKKDKEANFYDKLKSKSPVKVLVLGDGIALSQGSTTNGGEWAEGVANLIKNTYGSEVELKSLAKSGTKAADGLIIAKNNDFTSYDLVITCYGQTDNNAKVDINSFKTSYNDMIKEIKSKNNNIVIIPVLESTLTVDNNYRKAIIETAENNSLTAADVKQAFVDSGAEASLNNGSLPNDKGYKYYETTIGNVIKSNVA